MRWKLIVGHCAALALMTSTQAAAQATKSAEPFAVGTFAVDGRETLGLVLRQQRWVGEVLGFAGLVL